MEVSPKLDIDTLNSTVRWEVSPTDLDAAENAWWQEYADVEEEYCWVQTPAIQKFLRGSYISRIADSLSPNDVVLELGCGTGWLSVLLAEIRELNIHCSCINCCRFKDPILIFML